jgi:hypothetical protein
MVSADPLAVIATGMRMSLLYPDAATSGSSPNWSSAMSMATAPMACAWRALTSTAHSPRSTSRMKASSRGQRTAWVGSIGLHALRLCGVEYTSRPLMVESYFGCPKRAGAARTALLIRGGFRVTSTRWLREGDAGSNASTVITASTANTHRSAARIPPPLEQGRRCSGNPRLLYVRAL